MNALEVRGLAKRFGRVEALAGVDFDVHEGETFILLGPSGCGKSTLLRLIAGLERPTRGSIRIHGREVTDAEPRDRDVAMVFQNYALYPHMSVRRNLAFPLEVRSVAQAEREARVADAVRLLGIEDLLDRRPSELSGGQRQRVAIGRAIVRRPALFLFDEPLSNLDAQLRARMRVELARLHRRLKATVLYVTHDQVEAMTLGDRIMLMRDGRIEQTGRPADLYQRPASVFAAAFIGSPPMNLIPLEAIEELGGPRIPESSGAATIGVRPEDLLPGASGDWSARVEVVENLGAEALVHLQAGGVRLTLRQPGAASCSSGSPIRITPRRLHYFDRDGRRIETVAAPGFGAADAFDA